MKVAERLVNVFVSPNCCFTSLRDEKTNWADYVIPLVLLIAMVLVFLAATEDITRQTQVDTIMKMDQLSEEQKEAALQRLDSPLVTTLKYVTSVISVAVSALFTALIFMIVGNFIGGGEQKFGIMLLSALYIQLISIPESILKLIIMLQKETVHVYIGLASLIGSPNFDSFGFQFLGQLEFFKIWRIVVWVVAFRVLYQFNKQKSTLLVVITMLIGMLIAALWTSMSMGY
jgi:hypothetical protein